MPPNFRYLAEQSSQKIFRSRVDGGEKLERDLKRLGKFFKRSFFAQNGHQENLAPVTVVAPAAVVIVVVAAASAGPGSSTANAAAAVVVVVAVVAVVIFGGGVPGTVVAFFFQMVVSDRY